MRLFAVLLILTGMLVVAPSGVASAAIATKVTRGITPRKTMPFRRVLVRGAVTPIRAGHSVRLQEFVDGKWEYKATRTLDSDGRYRFYVRRGTGYHSFRVVVPASGRYATGVSDAVRLTVWRIRYLSLMDPVEGYFDTGSVDISGTTYARSLYDWSDGIDETESVDYNLSRDCVRLWGWAGIADDSVSTAGSMFNVYTDGTQRTSFVKSFGEDPTPLNVDLTGQLRLRLENIQTKDTDWDDMYSAWGDARIICYPLR